MTRGALKPLNTLPIIIDEPGEYATRDGGRVTIREIHPSPSEGTTAFTAKGSVWSLRRDTYRSRGHDVWHVSGRYRVLEFSGKDIIGKYQKPAWEDAEPSEVAQES